MSNTSMGPGTLPIPDSYAWPSDVVAPGSIPVRCWHLAIPRPLGGCSEQRSSRRGLVEASWATVMPIPSNVSPLVRGAEMRVAETRAVNRALRKAYGIGICSVEEIGSFAEPVPSPRETKKLPPQPVNGKNGNYCGPKVRDRLCQLIRQHQLDANLVKSYAVDFCGTKSLREATREQVEAFVAHLADWAEKDRNALLCQLNSYPRTKEEGAA